MGGDLEVYLPKEKASSRARGLSPLAVPGDGLQVRRGTHQTLKNAETIDAGLVRAGARIRRRCKTLKADGASSRARAGRRRRSHAAARDEGRVRGAASRRRGRSGCRRTAGGRGATAAPGSAPGGASSSAPAPRSAGQLGRSQELDALFEPGRRGGRRKP